MKSDYFAEQESSFKNVYLRMSIWILEVKSRSTFLVDISIKSWNVSYWFTILWNKTVIDSWSYIY